MLKKFFNSDKNKDAAKTGSELREPGAVGPDPVKLDGIMTAAFESDGIFSKQIWLLARRKSEHKWNIYQLKGAAYQSKGNAELFEKGGRCVFNFSEVLEIFDRFEKTCILNKLKLAEGSLKLGNYRDLARRQGIDFDALGAPVVRQQGVLLSNNNAAGAVFDFLDDTDNLTWQRLYDGVLHNSKIRAGEEERGARYTFPGAYLRQLRPMLSKLERLGDYLLGDAPEDDRVETVRQIGRKVIADTAFLGEERLAAAAQRLQDETTLFYLLRAGSLVMRDMMENGLVGNDNEKLLREIGNTVVAMARERLGIPALDANKLPCVMQALMFDDQLPELPIQKFVEELEAQEQERAKRRAPAPNSSPGP